MKTPRNPFKTSGKRRTVTDLLNIMARLRGPSGCPWDREQTEQTLKKFLIEEAYETLEAIEAGSPETLKEELGDLLLQIVFLSRIAEVVHALAEKLIRRHPHVFTPVGGDRNRVKPRNALEVAEVWGTIKEMEGKYAKRVSLLDGLPLALPSLERARRMSQRVSRVGFDWPSIEAVWKKVEEELRELKEANRGRSREAVEEEIGDLLFTLVNWARFKGLSAEEALRKANRRFAKRFGRVELELGRRGKTLEGSTLEEMDCIWNKVKKTKKLTKDS
jgi:MazG family protein